MTHPPPELDRNKFDEWCWRRGIDLPTAAEALDVSIETVRRIRLPFGNPKRRVPAETLVERIFTYTGGQVAAGDWYRPEVRRGAEVEP